MKNKVRFFQSVNFKIALTFILILLIAIQIIGAYFIRELERTTVDAFKRDMEARASTLVVTLGSELSRMDNDDGLDWDSMNASLNRILTSTNSSEILEMRVVDEQGIIRATTNINDRGSVGEKMITVITIRTEVKSSMMNPAASGCSISCSRSNHRQGIPF